MKVHSVSGPKLLDGTCERADNTQFYFYRTDMLAICGNYNYSFARKAHQIGLGSTCDLVRKLIHHCQLGDHSKYAPFVQYIINDTTNAPRLPSMWSQPAKHPLETIVGK
jgi:hypothetical protein